MRATSGLLENMVMMASTHDLDIKDVLKYPLGPVPWSLTANGLHSPRKTAKSILSQELNMSAAVVVPLSSAGIIYEMAIVHKIRETRNFLGTLILFMTFYEASNIDRQDIVSDVDNENSIKTAERQ